MTVSLQVLYPVSEGTTFDYDYYTKTHLALVGTHMGAHIESATAIKGLAGGPDTPAGFHAVATILCKDQATMDAMLGGAGPVLADIPNFTNVQPQMLIGEVIS